jgi:pyruvate dehydrogenase E2 component (dihydrolipoamide acetyltransferase)
VRHEVVLPELGENIEAADVTAVLVAVGDRIRRDQAVIEVETEKATLEVPATIAGRVVELQVSPGDTIDVGRVILVVDSNSDGAPVATDEALPSPDAEPGHSPPPAVEEAAGAVATAVDPRARAAPTPPRIGETAPAAPSVRALARELGVAIDEVPGSGPGGRISRNDVMAFAKRVIGGARSPRSDPPAAVASPALPDLSRWGAVSREPLTRIRRVTAERLSRAWTSVPHVTQFDQADITHLETLRRDFNRRPESGEIPLTLTAVALKMVAAALRRFPKFNAGLDLDHGEVVFRDYVHIGVAVDTDRGLLVPVVRDVDRKSLPQVAMELSALADRARQGKLEPDEMAGAGFTVSNLGGLGTTWFSPIVNWPEVAILGVGRATMQAVHAEGRFRPRRILPLSVSYDHRLIDGADAARFLRWLAEALEQPLLLLFEERRERPT